MYFNELEKIEDFKIRHHKDEKSRQFYFSIIDVIENLNLSKDPRNYWKVLKNRLKKGHNELVTSCNQLKMISSDGKYYLTDVATSINILKIIQLISPSKVVIFDHFFNLFEEKKLREDVKLENIEKISTVEMQDKKINADVSIHGKYILVKTFIEGIDPSDIFISVNYKNLTIKINRERTLGLNENNLLNTNFHLEELSWGRFSRTITLPFEIDIDKVEATTNHGVITLKLFILDKDQTRIIKIKSI